MRRRKVITTLHGADVSVCTSCTFNSAITDKATRPVSMQPLIICSLPFLQRCWKIRHFRGHFKLYFKASLSAKSLLKISLFVFGQRSWLEVKAHKSIKLNKRRIELKQEFSLLTSRFVCLYIHFQKWLLNVELYNSNLRSYEVVWVTLTFDIEIRFISNNSFHLHWK